MKYLRRNRPNLKGTPCRLLDLKEEEISAFVRGEQSLQDEKVRGRARWLK